jgi:uncharacterized protein (DUF302 family)
MSYYFSTIIQNKSFDETLELVTDLLKEEGFGVLTEIDVQATLKMKIGVDFRKYKILGACNPHYAHKALQCEPKIGVFLPCNVIVEEIENGNIEVSAMDPVMAMSAVGNRILAEIAVEIRQKLQRVIENLPG